MNNFDMAIADLIDIGRKAGSVTDNDIIEITIKYDIATLKIESLIEYLIMEGIHIAEQQPDGRIEAGNTNQLPESTKGDIEKKRVKCRNVIERKLKYEEERIKLLEEPGEVVKKDFLRDLEKARCQSTYMAVVVLAFFNCADENGNSSFKMIAEYFRSFYSNRKRKNMPVERPDSIFSKGDPDNKETRKLILFNPLGRSCLVKYFGYDKKSDILSINANLWSVLLASDVIRIRKICEGKIDEYFNNMSKE